LNLKTTKTPINSKISVSRLSTFASGIINENVSFGGEIVRHIEGYDDVNECLRTLRGRVQTILFEYDRAAAYVQIRLITTRLNIDHVPVAFDVKTLKLKRLTAFSC
jgi:hypothetical protein